MLVLRFAVAVDFKNMDKMDSGISPSPKQDNEKPETEKEIKNDPQIQLEGEELFTSVAVQNEVSPQTLDHDYDGPLFQWTPEEQLKRDKLSHDVDFRALFSSSSSNPVPAPALTSANELAEYLETSEHLISAPTPTATESIKNEQVSKEHKEMKLNEPTVQLVVGLKEQYNFGPILLDSSVWEVEEEEEEELEQKDQFEEPPTAQSSVKKSELRQASQKQWNSTKDKESGHLQR